MVVAAGASPQLSKATIMRIFYVDHRAGIWGQWMLKFVQGSKGITLIVDHGAIVDHCVIVGHYAIVPS